MKRLVITVIVTPLTHLSSYPPDMCTRTQIVREKRKREKVERVKRKLSYGDIESTKKSKKMRRVHQKKKKTTKSARVNHDACACCPLSNSEIEHVIKVHDMKYSEALRSQLQVGKNTVYRYIRRIKAGMQALLGKRGGQWKLKPEVERQIGEASRSHNIKNFDAVANQCMMLDAERRGKAFKKESKRTAQRYFKSQQC